MSEGVKTRSQTKNEIEGAHAESEFICGAVEGFYGRPWTTEQRKDLFVKFNKWGLNSYMYAPKDDYKHRVYWRELYSVEESEHLTSLIKEAHNNNVKFYYALSPGLDITYSSPKDIACLKRKLDQVAQFGCDAFSLLFDDILSEMSEPDKEAFQSFANAQVSVTNEIFQHLGQPKFLFCPTQYCAMRAVPDVATSEYLNTIGTKLDSSVDIMWTGSKVITKNITVEGIEELTEILKRPPVIWDNIHANDYDMKRVYLGPYSWRSSALKSRLRGVMTNPNCEYGANFIAIHTLAQWSKCSSDVLTNGSLTPDIRLETETDNGGVEDEPAGMSPNVYHPKRAMRIAINEWKEEFQKPTRALGIMAKPQLQAAVAAPVPIVPSLNTCMTNTSATVTTLTSTTGGSTTLPPAPSVPVAPINPIESVGGVGPPVVSVMMNSLQSETKVVPTAFGIVPTPAGPAPTSIVTNSESPNQEMSDTTDFQKEDSETECSLEESKSTPEGEPMDCNPTPPAASPQPSMQIESEPDSSTASDSCKGTMVVENGTETDSELFPPCPPDKEITVEDLQLLVDLFYLPFEHGQSGLTFLQEFHWLKLHAYLADNNKKDSDSNPEVKEWFERADKYGQLLKKVNELFDHLTYSPNRSLVYDLYPYLWDIRVVIELLNSYVTWLRFSKGWKDTFMSGDQEPWAFRGGLTGDLQRLIPIDSPNELFLYKCPDIPVTDVYSIRPYRPSDEAGVYDACRQVLAPSTDFSAYPDLLPDKVVGGFLTLSPEHCFVAEFKGAIVGYCLAAKDAKQFHSQLNVAYLPQLQEKYPKQQDNHMLTPLEEVILEIHKGVSDPPVGVGSTHKSRLHMGLVPSVLDQSVPKRLVSLTLSSLRTQGTFSAYTSIENSNKGLIDFYMHRLGFHQIEDSEDCAYLGRTF